MDTLVSKFSSFFVKLSLFSASVIGTLKNCLKQQLTEPNRDSRIAHAYPLEFKQMAVAMAKGTGVTVGQVAEELKINPWKLGRWASELDHRYGARVNSIDLFKAGMPERGFVWRRLWRKHPCLKN